MVATLASGTAPSGSSDLVTPDEIQQIAAQALDAAQTGLEKALNDPGLKYTFYVLTQVVLAARQQDWQQGLEHVGIELSDDSTIFDLTAEIQAAIDDHLRQHGPPTDISEIAQRAAGDAVTALAGPKSKSLFGEGLHELQHALRELSTKKGFSQLGQNFFGHFMARYLNFYLSRITASEVGERLQHVGNITAFNEALQHHCHQSARIVRDFCGEWYSKTEFQEGIDVENTSRFMAVAVKKLQAEIQRQKVGL